MNFQCSNNPYCGSSPDILNEVQNAERSYEGLFSSDLFWIGIIVHSEHCCLRLYILWVELMLNLNQIIKTEFIS